MSEMDLTTLARDLESMGTLKYVITLEGKSIDMEIFILIENGISGPLDEGICPKTGKCIV